MAPVVAVEEVERGKELVRFAELPHALSDGDERFAPMVTAWERYRLDRRRNPYFETGDAACFLARRMGRPVGRIAAHQEEPGGVGRFGFWWVDDDAQVAAALIEAGQIWLAARGCTSMEGPRSFTPEDEEGVQVSGHHVPGVSGRPWHPPHLARLLEESGLVSLDDRPTWRLPTGAAGPDLPLDDDLPGQAGAYADPRVVLQGIAAVPDVAGALRAAGLRSAWALAKRARAGDWDTAVVVRCTADPSVAVPALQAAAGRAGYTSVIAPWSPGPSAEPEAVHRTYRLTW
jgi:hypothetical protein